MPRTVFGISLTVAAVVLATAAQAGSAAQLLEKGVYTEETVGDLDKAIAIYGQVISEAKAARVLATQAQFRIGQCLWKQGKKAEARAAFEKLIADYPEAKEFVTKARKFVPEGLPLEAVPWVDGETLQLNIGLASKLDIGTTVYFAHTAELKGQRVWRVGSHTLVPMSNMIGTSRVDCDWNTFRPIHSVYKNSLLGNNIADYTPSQVVIASEGPQGKSTRKLDLTQVVYDNEEGLHVMRRLPLAPGYKTTLSVLATMGGGKIDLPLEVQGKEMVKVPAGEFECFKVHLGIVNQDFWIGTDPHRYFVKLEANAVEGQLVSIGQVKPGQSRLYEDAKLGFSLSAPGDWFFYTPKPTRVYLLDPDATSMTSFSALKLADLDPKQRESLRTWAEARAADEGKRLTNFKIRPESRQERKVSGLPVLSLLADYTSDKRKMVHFGTYVHAESIGLAFSASLPADQLPGFRKSLDAVIDSLKVRQP